MKSPDGQGFSFRLDTESLMDTEGNTFDMVFWRFFLVEGEAEKPRARVVKLTDIRSA